MRHGSLFSGIGGFDLAAEWMGWENIFHCEWNEFGQKILKHYWPNAKSYGDITKTDFSIHRGSIDILTGGFPCQPYSTAGKRKGKEDDRHLWPEMLRAIREIQPRWIVGENVRGLTNWNGGVVFDEVQSDLEIEGYEVTPFLLPACGVNAPHRRDRIWFIAYRVGEEQREQTIGGLRAESRNGVGTTPHSNKIGQANGYAEYIPNKSRVCDGSNTKDDASNSKGGGLEGFRSIRETGSIGRTVCHNERDCENNAADTELIGQPGSGRSEGQVSAEAFGNWKASWADSNGGWPTFSPIRGRNDGIPAKLAKQCLEGLGNAVVPQVVYQIFKAIQQYKS